MAASPADGRLKTAGSGPGSLAPRYALLPKQTSESTEMEKALCRVKLLKLHGSANWALCQNCGIINVLPFGPASVAHSHPTCVCGEVMDGRLIVPPAWNKEEYLPLLKPVWQSAAKALGEAQRVWLLGYSMPESDKFFEYLLALSLHQNKHLDEVVIVNSDGVHIEKFVKLFRMLDEKKKIKANRKGIRDYVKDGSFQRDLKQTYKKFEFAW